MKRKITLLLLAASSVLTMSSQVVLNEGFTSPFNLATSNWGTVNLSSPLGSLNWFQGNGNVMTAYDGGSSDYYAANYNNQGATTGTISSWLITPAVSIYNGAIFSFATQSGLSTTPVSPDRLQLRMSATTNSTISGGVTGFAPFNTLLLDINADYSTSGTSLGAVNNGTTSGYPGSWTVYTVQIANVTGTVTGRFAFRYFVEDGGVAGTRSDFIGIDRVTYTLPCGTLTAQSYTTCANTPITLNANGGLPATTYSWTGPAGSAGNSQSITVNAPASGTAVYTVQSLANGSLCGVSATAAVTQSTNLSVNITSSASSTVVCSGRGVTLTANAPATSFVWGTGGAIITTGTSTPGPNMSALTVTPPANATTVYTVGAGVGFPPSCYGTSAYSITVIPTPTLSYSTDPAVACPGGTLTLSTSGASTYTYVLSTNVTSNPVTITTPTDSGEYDVLVVATGTNGCAVGGIETFSVGGTPTITANANKTILCKNSTYSITAQGATSYSFSGTGVGTGTANPTTFTTGATAPTINTIVITGTDANGCTATYNYTVNVYTCTGIENINGSGIASVFPNPFSTELKLSGVAGNVEIYNALGQVVIKSAINDNDTINTADLTKGVYILKAYDANGQLVKTVKLLKN